MSLKLTGNWKKLRKQLSADLKIKQVEKAVQRATEGSAMRVVAAIRREIRDGSYAEQAALTTSVKGGKKRLSEDGDLYKAITYKMIKAGVAFVGVLRTNGSFNVAVIVHEGAEVKVTDKMRNMFRALYYASKKNDGSGLEGQALELWERSRTKRFFPLKDSTTTLKIPRRQFIQNVIESKVIGKGVIADWVNAVDEALVEK